MRYIGIDPGKRGAMGIIDTDQPPFPRGYVFDLPSSQEEFLDKFLDGVLFEGASVTLECPTPIPKQGAQSIATFWEQVGFIKGVLRSSGVEVLKVRPQDWKRVVFFGTPEAKQFKSLDKPASRALASRLWPEIDFGKRKTQDRADAILIAYSGFLRDRGRRDH